MVAATFTLSAAGPSMVIRRSSHGRKEMAELQTPSVQTITSLAPATPVALMVGISMDMAEVPRWAATPLAAMVGTSMVMAEVPWCAATPAAVMVGMSMVIADVPKCPSYPAATMVGSNIVIADVPS